jgi:hypothetical protein
VHRMLLLFNLSVDQFQDFGLAELGSTFKEIRLGVFILSQNGTLRDSRLTGSSLDCSHACGSIWHRSIREGRLDHQGHLIPV